LVPSPLAEYRAGLPGQVKADWITVIKKIIPKKFPPLASNV
jgi:hypothetical protein